MLATTNVCPLPIRFQHMGRPGAEGPSLCRWVAKAIAPDPLPPPPGPCSRPPLPLPDCRDAEIHFWAHQVGCQGALGV